MKISGVIFASGFADPMAVGEEDRKHRRKGAGDE